MKSQKAFNKVAQYIDDNINQEITIDMLVQLGHSRRQLYKLFQMYSPVPIMEYIRRRKLYAAASDIFDGKALLDVAENCGYETHAGFFKAFFAMFGCSPTNYKNNLRINTMENQLKTQETIAAIEELNTAIQLDPDNFKLYDQRAHLYYEIGEYKKSAQDCTKVIQLCPWDVSAYTNRANLYRTCLNDYQSAIADYDKILQIQQQSIAATYSKRAACYVAIRQLDKAKVDFDKAIQYHPENSRLYVERAWSLGERDEYEKAIAMLEDTIEENPHDTVNLDSLGTMKMKSGQYEKALADYARIMAIGIGDTHESKMAYLRAFLNRGATYEKMEEFDKAEADFNRSVELEIEFGTHGAWTSWRRGEFYRRRGEISKAIADCDLAFKQEPDFNYSSDVYTTRGYCYGRLGKYALAIADLSAAIKSIKNGASMLHAWKIEDMYKIRGTIYERMEESNLAIADYKEGLKINPEHEEIHGLLHKLLSENR